METIAVKITVCISNECRILREVLGWFVYLTLLLQIECLWQGHITENSPLSDLVKGKME